MLASMRGCVIASVGLVEAMRGARQLKPEHDADRIGLQRTSCKLQRCRRVILTQRARGKPIKKLRIAAVDSDTDLKCCLSLRDVPNACPVLRGPQGGVGRGANFGKLRRPFDLQGYPAARNSVGIDISRAPGTKSSGISAIVSGELVDKPAVGQCRTLNPEVPVFADFHRIVEGDATFTQGGATEGSVQPER